MQRLDKACAQTVALKVPELPSSDNFAQGHPKPAFSEKGQKGNQKNFSKIAQKVALVWMAQKHTGENGIIL